MRMNLNETHEMQKIDVGLCYRPSLVRYVILAISVAQIDFIVYYGFLRGQISQKY